MAGYTGYVNEALCVACGMCAAACPVAFSMEGKRARGGREIPAEYLSDERFAALITEAEKYLGYPYGATCSQLKRLGTCPMIGGEKKDR